ncbi:hypothetical protein CBS101457_003194 [Exobasidium rhododendri]|nr:hypothetical protein CBS101457_003194 [Exobasidium rhododendri]
MSDNTAVQTGPSAPSSGGVAIEIESNEASIGQGRVVDPAGLGGRGGTWGAENSSENAAPVPSRSHYHLSRNEVMKGLANRFVHSTGYIYFYAGMAIASLLTVFISLLQECPGTIFYVLELIINALLIAEVGIRGYAFGKQFWKSTFNIVDLCLVLLCAITLAVLFFSHDCSPYRRGEDHPGPGEDLPSNSSARGGRSEELLDSLLLIIRNGAQLFRLVSVIRRSSSNVTTRVPNIDLDDARRFSLDLDLEEEGLAARERMADGGDRGARLERERQNNGAALSDERRQLFDYEDDDEEL